MLPPPPHNFILLELDFDVKFPLLLLLLFLSDSTISDFKDISFWYAYQRKLNIRDMATEHHIRELHESSSFYAFHLYYYYSLKQFSFRFRFGLSNAINDYQRFKICVVCVGNF